MKKKTLIELGNHLDALRPEQKPTKETIAAARGAATRINKQTKAMKAKLRATKSGTS